MRTRMPFVAALAVIAISLFGCGGDDTGGATDGALVVEASEFAFEPESVTIAADADVEITLDNVGAVEHDWTIEELDVHIHADAGETVTGTVNVPAGTYEVICRVPGHAEAGMVGTLIAE
jgi:plastocyanin